jgi:hypothetical protein
VQARRNWRGRNSDMLTRDKMADAFISSLIVTVPLSVPAIASFAIFEFL